MKERFDQRNISFLEQFQIPAVRAYIFMGLAALLVYYTVASERIGMLGALLTIVIAVPGLTSRWIISPVLFLVLITYLLFDPNFANLVDAMDGYRRGYGRTARFHTYLTMSDLLLAVCILVYMAAHYRILGFVYKSMPDDPAPRRKGQPEPDTPRRPFRLFGDREVPIVLGVVAVAVLGGVALWEIISGYENGSRIASSWGITRSFARFIVFMWSVGTGCILVGVVFRALALRRMSAHEARLIVQDQFLLDTRREQERIYRWRAWADAVRKKNKGEA